MPVPNKPNDLIQSAGGVSPGGSPSGSSSLGAAPSGGPANGNQTGEVNPQNVQPGSPESGQGDPLDQIGQQLVEMMRQNPQLALQIADLIEGKGGSQPMDATMGGAPGGMPGGAPATPAAPMAPSTPAAGTNFSQFGAPQGGQGPTQIGGQGAQGAISMGQLPPQLLAQLEMFQKSNADQHVDRQMARMGPQYQKMRGHFGNALPENMDEQALLQKVSDVMGGKVDPFDIAHALMVMEQATGGEGNLKDRILAGAAQARGSKLTPPQEGRGGGIATGENQDGQAKPKNSTELMKKARQMWESMQGQTGT